MQRKIIYIINPISGGRAKKDLQQLIEERTRLEKIPFVIMPSYANGNYSDSLSIIEKEKFTDVVIVGGDGTVSQVVGSLMNADVNFSILPSGSGNGLAYAAKIPKQISKALDLVFSGHPSPVDGFYVNTRFGCMLCGLGFDAKVAHDFAEQPKRGLSTYIKEVVRNFFSAKTYKFTIQLNQVQFDTEAFFISIANSNQYGNNFTIAPKASLSDGLLDIVIVTKQNKLSMILRTLQQVMGGNQLQIESAIDRKKAVIYFQTSRFSIINKSNAPIHIDGDPAKTSEKIEIEIKEKCFRLIQP